MDNSEKIKNLEAKIKKLQAIYANEITESWTQGHQTQMMIDQYTEQLNRLKEKSDESRIAKAGSDKNKIYFIESNSGEKRKFELVEKNPDPSNGQISVESPIGIKLQSSNLGQPIEIGGVEYIIKEIG